MTRGVGAMTIQDYELKLNEVDRLLNDPTMTLRPDRVWSLMDELARAAASLALDATGSFAGAQR